MLIPHEHLQSIQEIETRPSVTIAIDQSMKDKGYSVVKILGPQDAAMAVYARIQIVVAQKVTKQAQAARRQFQF